MRALILLAGASLALTACNKHDQAGTAPKADESLSADAIVANDVTAIDAVTADSANMAADVNYDALDEAVDNLGDNSATPVNRHSSSRQTPPKPTARPAAKTAPPGNSN